MASVLLVKFDQERYKEHMQDWADYVRRVDGHQSGSFGTASAMPNRLGFYRGGQENILRKNPYTARGRQSESDAPKQFYPEGFDTEEFISMAVDNLRQANPGAAAAVEQQFLKRGASSEKAERLGITLPLYKNRLAIAKTYICAYMRGLKQKAT